MIRYPAYDHWKILRMPWVTFLALSEEAQERQRRERDARFFRDTGLSDEWEANKDEWLRLQPPPPGRR